MKVTIGMSFILGNWFYMAPAFQKIPHLIGAQDRAIDALLPLVRLPSTKTCHLPGAQDRVIGTSVLPNNTSSPPTKLPYLIGTQEGTISTFTPPEWVSLFPAKYLICSMAKTGLLTPSPSLVIGTK